MERLSQHTHETELKDFLFYRMAGGDNHHEALARARAYGVSDRVLNELQKTSSPSASSASLSVPLGLALTRLIANNSPRAVFDVMRGDMVEVPLRSRVIINSTAIAGGEVAEAAAKPMRRLNLTNLDTETSKFVAQVALSREFIDAAPQLAQRILVAALTEAVGRATDTYFLGKLQAEEIFETSNPDPTFTYTTMVSDLLELLTNVQTGDASKLYFIMPPRLCKALSAAAFASGIDTVRYDGGQIFGIPIITSQAAPAGRVTLADASMIAFGDDGFEVRSTDVANFEMSDTPTGDAAAPTAVSTVSAWQTNMRAVLCERRIAVRVCDTNAISTISGLLWASGFDSPMAA